MTTRIGMLLPENQTLNPLKVTKPVAWFQNEAIKAHQAEIWQGMFLISGLVDLVIWTTPSTLLAL